MSIANETKSETTLELCDKVVHACKDALDANKEELRISDLAIRQSKDVIATQNVIIKDQSEELNAWYRNPFVTIPLGLVVGGAITVILTK